jgi:signal transduction histidine kinase
MKRRNVLVVDDDAHILEVLEMRLAAMGLAVTATTDPTEALRILGERGFDAALFDLRMDPLDGIALTRAAHEKQSRLPVLIMTAHGTVENAVQAIKEGAFDFITKPFVTEELAGKLARALTERRWARDRDLLRALGDTLASSGVVDRVLEVVAERTMEATETERAVVFLRTGTAVAPRASAGASAAALEDMTHAAEKAVADRAPILARGPEGRVTLAAPLVVDGTPVGALVADSPSYVVVTTDDLMLLALFAAQAAVALKNAREQSRLRGGALAALGRVATQVAHELNNPLGGLKLYASLLQERFRKAGDVQGVEMAAKVDAALTHLSDLATDITAYGRPPELRRESTRVNALVEECLALAADRVSAHHVSVVRALDERVGEMPLDARELRKALLNLVLNGVDAMADGGTLTVRTRKLDGGRVEIGVEDTGSGMDAETRARMFDLFFTTKSTGTGLGMAIARSVVDLHGVRLEIDIAPGRGTRVRIELPAS